MAERQANRQKPYRVMYRFWLDITREIENHLAEYINELKEQRGFSQTIRDALRLICDLRQGRVEVLLALFPWVEDHFKQDVSIPANDPMRHQISLLTEALLKQGAVPITRTIPAKSTDEIAIEITEIKKDADNNSAWNFMISSAIQVYGSYDSLPPQIIEYGVRTGRIPKNLLPDKRKTSPSEGEQGNPKAMQVPEFAAPSFDDLEL